MASLNTHISWTDSTWNPTTGCTAISAGCDHCYAKAMTTRLFGGDFETVRLHPDRLGQGLKFAPVADPGGPRPRLVFVNSMSDLFHKDIPDVFRDAVFERMEAATNTVFQVLTKRGMTLRRYVAARYKAGGVPDHIWLGVSVEDGRVHGRIDTLRRAKEDVGGFTAFLSVEPLIGRPARHDYQGIDQVLIGGESGGHARPCEPGWAYEAIAEARHAGAAVWGKQWGTWRNNPLYAAAKAARHIDRVREAIDAGELLAKIAMVNGREKITGEKGGATFLGKTYREYPPVYAKLTARLRQHAGLIA